MERKQKEFHSRRPSLHHFRWVRKTIYSCLLLFKYLHSMYVVEWTMLKPEQVYFVLLENTAGSWRQSSTKPDSHHLPKHPTIKSPSSVRHWAPGSWNYCSHLVTMSSTFKKGFDLSFITLFFSLHVRVCLLRFIQTQVDMFPHVARCPERTPERFCTEPVRISS